MSDPANMLALAMMGSCLLLSLVALFYLFHKHVDGRPLIAYEPRRRVPWGPGWAAVAAAFALLAVFDVVFPAPNQAEVELDAQEMLVNGWTQIFVLLALVAVSIGGLYLFAEADSRDLGFPSSWKQLLGDLGLGGLVCFASLLPVFLIQMSLLLATDSQTRHPLVESLMENHTPGLIWMSWIAAVVAAPVFEEFAFRLLLQGWLERREDELLGFSGSLRYAPQEAPLEPDEQQPLESASEVTTPTPAPELPPNQPVERPAHGWIESLPHGWTPILVSGILFGIAHLGHGVAPIPLVFFGIALGYLYQRTHRLVPCIVAHSLFNAYSMTLLMLQLRVEA